MSPSKVAIKKESRLYDYEMVVVISPGGGEEQFEATVESIRRFVTGRGGTVSELEKLGKRALAYPIRHFVDGNYVLARFSMTPAFGKELEAYLRISEQVLRHLLIKLSPVASPPLPVTEKT